MTINSPMGNSARVTIWLGIILPTLIAVLFGLVTLIRDFWLFNTFSFSVYLDSFTYIDYTADLRTGIYPFFNYFLQSSRGPTALILFQIVVGVLSVMALVYVVAKHNLLFGAAIGIALASDTRWGAANLAVLTEGLFTSLHIFAAAVLVRQFARRKRLKAWEFFAAGVCHMLAFTIRPSGILLFPVAVGAYLLFISRSWHKIALLCAGGVIVILLNAGFAFTQIGKLNLVGSPGYYLAFPLFSYRLFSPDNGPASEELADVLERCDLRDVYPEVTDLNSNQFFWQQALPCMTNQLNWSTEAVSDVFARSYTEAIRADVIRFVEVIAIKAQAMIATPILLDFVVREPGRLSSRDECQLYEWCEALQSDEGADEHQRELQISYLLDYSRSTIHFQQLHQELGVWLIRIIISGATRRQLNMVTTLVLTGMISFMLVRSTSQMRLLVGASAIFIGYTVLTVVAGHVFTQRYGLPLVPFYAIISATFLVTVVQLAYQGIVNLRAATRQAKRTR
jgi:hypothetical protein